MYKHVKARFKEAGLPLPYGESGFAPNPKQARQVDEMLHEVTEYWQLLVSQGVFLTNSELSVVRSPVLKMPFIADVFPLMT